MSHLQQNIARQRLAVAVAAALAAVPALAQQGGMKVAQQAEMEELEVRAASLDRRGLALDSANGAGGRLGLSAMDTPASVEIVSKEAIALKGDFSGNAAVTRATGFASSASPGNGGSSTSVRGFNGHGSVVTTYDGTRLYVGSGTVNFPADTWTVERVEVLRGPGSVINGVGAIGATLNYVPKRPEFEPITTEFDVTGGSNDLRRFAVGSGGALGDSVAFRLDVVNHRSDGYVDRAEEDRTAVAGALLFRPTDDLDIRLSVDFADTEDAPYWGAPLVDGEVPGDIRRNNYNVADAIVAYQDLWPRLNLNWRINDNLELRSDTFYMDSERQWRNVESYDYNAASGEVDRSFYLEILHDQEQLGNRSDLLWRGSIAGMENRLSVGAEVNVINFSHLNNSPYAGGSSVDLDKPVPGRWADGVGSETTADFDTETTQGAVFVDNVLALSEQWQLVAGLRYDRIDYERDDRARSNGQAAGSIDSELSGSSWRLGAVYQPNDYTSLYAQASTAMDSIQSILSASNPDLDLAEGEQLELGIKQQFMDGRLQYTVALYDITKHDLVSADPGGVQRQIGEQSSRGVEFELFWLPLDTLSVDLNMAFTDPEYEEFVSGDSDYSGNTPRNVPERTANLWLTWQAMPAWTVSGGLRYVGERYLNDANSAELPDYTVWDATLQWQVNDQLRVSLRGKNLSDSEDYVLAPYGNQWILGDGRTAEVGLNYRF
ncbi:TonB-dependent receptor [Parahaliea mediterranea]|uniref:TonB-dependent siderophore receptor n=1 Tax=Parahaliea mediterranea TaxID=651086 RepID=A0A939DBN9_9GAMM|nr:TonB-dependent siderophore receptor [Parahaliea mediterranea]MBN7794951.1 TonB-dependent siderophore receptor [Parahaliea mediterranea]